MVLMKTRLVVWTWTDSSESSLLEEESSVGSWTGLGPPSIGCRLENDLFLLFLLFF